MKLLFAIKRLENMAGGAERVILQVIGGLKKAYGHEITLVTFDRVGAESFYPLPDGIRWIQLGIGDSSRRAGVFDTFQRILALRDVVRQSGADILVPFQHSCFVPLVLATLGMGQKIVASEHIVPDHYRQRPLEYLLLVFSGLFCRKITVLSESIIKMYPSCLWSRMVAVPNPIETSESAANVIGEGRKILISVGRLDAQKDQKTLIESFSKISKDFPEWDLKIFGEGALRDNLQSQICSLGLEDRVALCGVSRDIFSEYQKAQAFVLASRYEAFGLATAEAMSAGLPVIGFADCPGTNELIGNRRNGILVRVQDREQRADALARGVAEILGNPTLRRQLGEQGRLDMAALSPDVVVKKWHDLLLSV